MDFPRIRGDGPHDNPDPQRRATFSPYSRGWSLPDRWFLITQRIFPVFAGMVPGHVVVKDTLLHFPRIRGDGP